MIQKAIETVVGGESLSRRGAAKAMNRIMSGEATPAQFGAFVTALRMKGETPEEIAGMVEAMREKSLHVDVDGPLVDTSGTGGDASGTFNISTTAGFVVAACGVKVAKHGNRAMSGASGSADVLEGLGVKIELSPEGVKRCIEEVGYGFMFAQTYHPSMKFAAGPRREIGIRTIFNVLGPLTNPAGAEAQLIGVADSSLAEKIATVLGMLGTSHALVVHGEDGMDEISLGAPTQIWELKGGEVSTYRVTPAELGFELVRRSDLKIESVAQSVRMVREVLHGAAGPTRNIVLVNASGAMLAADRVGTLREGINLAAQAIDTGAAKRKLDELVELSQTLE